MSDVFISYSRFDKTFVSKLREALATLKQDIWIDWEDIPPSQVWWNEIKKGIARANNVIIILSPNSMASPVCHLEIEYARSLNKRLIPVYHADFDRETCLIEIGKRLAKKEDTAVHEIWGTHQPHTLYDENLTDISPINYFFFKEEEDFQSRFEALFTIIRTDYAHKEQHTTYELRAIEWKRRSEEPSFLLLDHELKEAQTWLNNAPGKEPAPTDVHRDYIQASEKRTRQLQRIRQASIIGSLVAAVASVFAVAASLVAVQAAASAADANHQQAAALVIQATAEQRADAANTQVAVAAMTATHSAIVQDMTDSFANIMIQSSSNQPIDRVAAMSEVVETYPDQAGVYILRGLTYELEGLPELAVADYTTALALDPDYAIAYSNRAVIYMAFGELDLALADYTTALKLNPEDALTYFNRANTYEALGESELAVIDYTAALELDSKTSDFYINRGVSYISLDHLDLAAEDFNSAIALDPTSENAYLNRGLLYHLQDQADLALADFSTVIALNPTNSNVYMARAYALFDDGQDAAAIAAVTEGIVLMPESAAQYDIRCELYLKTEQWSLGLADCETALTLDPDWMFSDEISALLETAREQVDGS